MDKDGLPTILIVHNDTDARQDLESSLLSSPALSARGLKTASASDGVHALAEIYRQKPAAVVVDLALSDSGGFELCRTLRADPQSIDIPIIVLSATDPPDVETALLIEEISAPCVFKPKADVDLAAQLDSILKNAPATSTLPHDGASPSSAAHGSAASAVPTSAMTPNDANPEEPASPPKGFPIPALLMGHLLAQSTGTLSIRLGQTRKEIYLLKGHPVSAYSNLRQDALGSLLIERKVIDEDQLALLLKEMRAQNQKMGSVLVSLGWLSPEDVLRYLAAQARKRIIDCLRHKDVETRFLPGDGFLEHEIEHEIDVPSLYFKGLLKTASPSELVENLAHQHGASTLVMNPSFDRFRADLEEVFGKECITAMADRPRLSSLVIRPDVSALLPALEALTLCRLGALEAPESAVSASPIDVEDATKSSMGLASFLNQPQVSSNSAPALDEDLSTLPEEIDAADLDAREGDFAAVPQAIAYENDSGVVSMGTLTSLSHRRAPQGEGASRFDARQSLLESFLTLHSANHYELLGLPVDAKLDQIIAAYEQRTRQFAPDVFANIDLGEDQVKLDAVRAAFSKAVKTLSNVTARTAYDAQLATAQSSDVHDPLEAELAFKRAQAHFDVGEYDAALSQLERALQQDPEQPEYMAQLGWVQFRAALNGGSQHTETARAHLEQALERAPDLEIAHEGLGLIALEKAQHQNARDHLNRALELNPTRLACLQGLTHSYLADDAFPSLERVYQRTIRQLGESRPDLRKRLWLDLARLYEQETTDASSTRIAYEMAARLAPEDAVLQSKVIELNAHDTERWRDIARALAAQWKLNPLDADSGSALVDLLRRAGRSDAASLASCALELRGLASAEQREMARLSEAHVLTRLRTSIDRDALSLIRHSGEDLELETLFTVLKRQGIIAPFADNEVLSSGLEPLPERHKTEPFHRVLAYVSEALRVDVPQRIFVAEALQNDARLADTAPEALFIGTGLMECTDTVELGFRLGRAMCFSTRGRLTGASRTGRQLKPFVMAVMAYSRQVLSESDLEVLPIVQQIEKCDEMSRKRLASLGGQLVRRGEAVNLSAWSRSLSHTANRIGLILSGDLLKAAKIVQEDDDQEALDELLAFAVSPEHFDLRDRLGVRAEI